MTKQLGNIMNTPEVKLVPLDIDMAKAIIDAFAIAGHEGYGLNQVNVQKIERALHSAFPDEIDLDCL